MENGDSHSKNNYYIDTYLGCGKRRMVVVSSWRFYLTWLFWFFTKPHFKKIKKLNVLYEEGCPPNEF